jgi:hypothetical protein
LKLTRLEGVREVPNLEPGVPKKRRRSVTPRPPLFDDAMESFNENELKSAKFYSIEEAEEYEKGIKAAVYWIRTWGPKGELPGDPEQYKIRGNPFITEHYIIDGVEYDADDGDLSEQDIADAKAHYWRVNFHLKEPEKRGMALKSPAEIRAIQAPGIAKKKAEAAIRRGATADKSAKEMLSKPKPKPKPKPKRTVAIRGE